MAQIQAGDKVTVAYTGKLEDGRVFDSSEGGEPITFTAGGTEVIPGVSGAVIGMEIGEKKTVTIEPDQAYGPRFEEAVRTVPRNALPDDAAVGDRLMAESPDKSQKFLFVLVEIGEETATLDGNHPLAGKTLVFDLEVLSVEAA